MILRLIRPGLVYPSLFFGGPQKQITTVRWEANHLERAGDSRSCGESKALSTFLKIIEKKLKKTFTFAKECVIIYL